MDSWGCTVNINCATSLWGEISLTEFYPLPSVSSSERNELNWVISKKLCSSEVAGFGVQRHTCTQAVQKWNSLCLHRFTICFPVCNIIGFEIYSWRDREARTGNHNEEELQEPSHLVQSTFPFRQTPQQLSAPQKLATEKEGLITLPFIAPLKRSPPPRKALRLLNLSHCLLKPAIPYRTLVPEVFWSLQFFWVQKCYIIHKLNFLTSPKGVWDSTPNQTHWYFCSTMHDNSQKVG